MKKTCLKNIADIKIGSQIQRLTAKKQSPPINIKLINLKAFDNFSAEFKPNSINNEPITIYQQNYNIIENNDILIRLREPFKAIIIKNNAQDYIISSLIANIKLKEKAQNICLPEFLAIYINSSRKIQNFLQKQSRGTGIISVGVSNLYEIQINIPNIEEQKKIIEANRLFERSLEVERSILEQKEKFYIGVMKEFFY